LDVERSAFSALPFFFPLPFYFSLYGILDVMYANAPYAVIQRAMHIHPTQQICFPQLSTINSQLLWTMLGELKSLE
jgi:hypothetical protein